MAILLPSPSGIPRHFPSSPCKRGKNYRGFRYKVPTKAVAALLQENSHADAAMSSASVFENPKQQKLVWIWTKSKQVMAAAVVRGWSTFIFASSDRELASDWSSIALMHPLIIEDGELIDNENKRVATFFEISSPQQLQQLESIDNQAGNVVINLLDWQVIPAENIVAAFQGSQKTVFAVATSSSEAQVFLEALEQGLGGVVLKVENVGVVLELKDYFDRRNETMNLLNLIKATVTRVQTAGMGDRVCVDLCSLMRPGEGLLVGSFARGLFLVHSECLESNYIASRPFRVNAGPVHAYVAVPGGKTCYLSELQSGKEVIVVDQSGRQWTAIVGRVKIESAHPCRGYGDEPTRTAIPVTSLKVRDEVMLRVQGGARHTGIEIQEFIVEK